MSTQIVATSLSLGIFRDLTSSSWRCLEHLSILYGVEPSKLERLLTALVGLELLEINPHDSCEYRLAFEFSTQSEADALHAYAHLISNSYYGAWSGLGDGISGKSSSNGDFWRAIESDGSLSRAFAAMMRFNNERSVTQILAKMPSALSGRILDVGAGDGTFLCQVLVHQSELTGTVLELPSQVPYCLKTIEEWELGHRCIAIAGDCLEEVPDGFDFFVLRSVLHNWDDSAAVTVLSNCARAMTTTSSLFVIERTPESSDRSYGDALRDLSMLAIFGSQDRSVDDYLRLADHAGLQVRAVHRTESMHSILHLEIGHGRNQLEGEE